MTEFSCEGLEGHGLVLLGPEAPGFNAMLEEIERRAGRAVDRGEWPAIFVNRAESSVAAMVFQWRFEQEDGRRYAHTSYAQAGRRLLLPFGKTGTDHSPMEYWGVVLPGSKRCVVRGDLLGDNSDVRPPREKEAWSGGGTGSGSAGASHRGGVPLRSVVLALDGAFFREGGFVGPNRCKLWESVTCEAEERLWVARVAHRLVEQGKGPAEILAALEEITGPVPAIRSGRGFYPLGENPGELRRHFREEIALGTYMRRQDRPDEDVVREIVDWLWAPVPRFRKVE